MTHKDLNDDTMIEMELAALQQEGEESGQSAPELHDETDAASKMRPGLLKDQALDFVAKHPRAAGIGSIVFVTVCGIILFSALHHAFGKSGKTKALHEAEIRQPVAASPALQSGVQEQLTDISDKLANIERQLNAPVVQKPVDLGSVMQPLAALQIKMDSLASQTNEITAAIKAETANTVGLSKQMVILQQELQSVGGVHHEVDASSLPFLVTSIDNIQESNVVTIRFNHTYLPVVVGDSIAGWTLITASNTNQSAEFKNANNDYVDIDLKRSVPAIIPVCGQDPVSGKGDC